MKKILLPTDFTETAWNALEHGVQLFGKEALEITLLHTYTPIIPRGRIFVSNPLEVTENVAKKEADVFLEKNRTTSIQSIS